MWNEEDFKYADMTGLYAHQQSVLNSLKQSYEHLQQTLVVVSFYFVASGFS